MTTGTGKGRAPGARFRAPEPFPCELQISSPPPPLPRGLCLQKARKMSGVLARRSVHRSTSSASAEDQSPGCLPPRPPQPPDGAWGSDQTPTRPRWQPSSCPTVSLTAQLPARPGRSLLPAQVRPGLMSVPGPHVMYLFGAICSSQPAVGLSLPSVCCSLVTPRPRRAPSGGEGHTAFRGPGCPPGAVLGRRKPLMASWSPCLPQ